MIAASAVSTAAAYTPPPRLRDGPIVRIVNALWVFPRGLDLLQLRPLVDCSEDEFFENLSLLYRAKIVEYDFDQRFRLTGPARRGMTR